MSTTDHTSVAMRLAAGVRTVLASRWTFAAIVLWTAAQGFLIAFTAAYALRYDESYHVGIIHLFAQQWSPWLQNSVASEGLGDVERYGSFLYHYLLGLPVHVASMLGVGDGGQLLIMRGITVVMSTSALFFFRSALLAMRVSPAITHLALFLVAALPISSFVAATVNYDNLLLPLTALFLLLAIRLYTKTSVSVLGILQLLTVGGIASITKYTFLPIFAAVLLSIAVRQILLARRLGRAGRVTSITTRDLRRPSVWALFVTAAVTLFFLVERYAVNLVLYRTPNPDCARVESIDYCSTYGVWLRNQAAAAAHPDSIPTIGNLVDYLSRLWLPGVVETLHVVGVTHPGGAEASYALPITSSALAAAVPIALVILLLTGTVLLRQPSAQIVAIALGAFSASLLVLNYTDYLDFGQALGVQSRYFLSFAPFIVAAVGVGIKRILDALHPRPLVWSAGIAVFLVVLATQGGGASTFFAQAGDDWFQPGGPISPLIPFLRQLATTTIVGG